MRIIVLDAFDLVMRCFQPGIGNNDNMNTTALFEGINFFAFLIE